MKKIIILLIFMALTQAASAQFLPGWGNVRQGNRQYDRENYVEAEAKYSGALAKNPSSYEGTFNLGDALYRQGRFEEAEQRFGALGQVPADPVAGAQTFYNQANTQVRQYKSTYNREKLTQALEAYKQSLRLHPEDREAKFNLAYVQKLLENEGGGGGENDQNQNQDQDQDQNQNQDQNQDQEQDPQNNDGQPQPQEGAMSREEAEQLLDAVQAGEDRTREQVDERQAVPLGRSGKNW